MEQSGQEVIFYTGTSKKRAEEIKENGFKCTRACTGNYGVWFYGVEGQSTGTEKGAVESAVESALSHAELKTLEERCSVMALIKITLPIKDILPDYPYYAFKTLIPDNIKIISIEYHPLKLGADFL